MLGTRCQIGVNVVAKQRVLALLFPVAAMGSSQSCKVVAHPAGLVLMSQCMGLGCVQRLLARQEMVFEK